VTPEVTEAYSADQTDRTDSAPEQAVDTAYVVDIEGFHDLSNDDYHADPVPDGSISSSALKIMVTQSPKHARNYQLNGRPPKGHFDLGSAVHTSVLGGAEIVYWGQGKGRDSWKSGAAQDFREGARMDGLIPLLEDQRQHVEGMVRAIYADPDLAVWLEPGSFTPEQSGFWVDQATGLWCRKRLDAAQFDPDTDTLTVVDLKTGYDVHPAAIAKALANHRYDIQRHHYEQGLRRLMALGLIPDADIVYVLAFVESSPPYDVVLRRIGPRTSHHAAYHWRYGMDRFAECRATGLWPGYDQSRDDSDEIPEAEAPAWQLDRWDYSFEHGEFDTTLGDRS
jgi:hypothetical protein